MTKQKQSDTKIKALLDSANECDHLLALTIAPNFGWSDWNIIYYVLNSGKGWTKYNWKRRYGDEIFQFDKLFCGSMFCIRNWTTGILEVKWHQCKQWKGMKVKLKNFDHYFDTEFDTQAETENFIKQIREQNLQY